MKRIPLLVVVIALVATHQSHAESRSVLIVASHDKAGDLRFSVYSDDKPDRRDGVDLQEVCKSIKGMKGWGSTVSVYVACDRPLGRKARKELFDAMDANAWLSLEQYGRETPKHLAEYFLKQSGR